MKKNGIKRKKFVLVHFYLQSGNRSIICFSDSYQELVDIMLSQPRFCSSHHQFLIARNKNIISGFFLTSIKNECLLNICKNVAEYLSIAEYAMLKKLYFKSSVWFEKAKNSAFLGSEILDNY